MIRLVINSEKRTKDRQLVERLNGLVSKIVMKEKGIKSSCGVQLVFCGNHRLAEEILRFCQMRPIGFHRVDKIRSKTIKSAHYCIDYTGHVESSKFKGLKIHKVQSS